MKNFLLISVFALFSLMACNEANNNDQSSTDSSLVTADLPKTYAEISIKEGGEWKDRKYEGGTFKNVQSLDLPTQHTDHSFYIRYEGPGWESNKIGYRLYLDWRNAIDIYGKLTDSMVLAGVGQDGFESYHQMSSWGMDILKVDKGLGIGAIGRFVNKKVLHFNEVDSTIASVENTAEMSSVTVSYYGWKTLNDKTDLVSNLVIYPDKRYTKHSIQSSKEIKGICTGIVNHGLEPIKKESENKKWAYIATYGEQSLIPDKLGMAILYQVADVESAIDWEFDHLLIFKPITQNITFYFLGAWEQEKNGIKTKEDFVAYLDGLLAELNKNDKI